MKSALQKDFQHLCSSHHLVSPWFRQTAKTHCQTYRTLTPLCLSKHFVEMIFTTPGYCRHKTAPCFMAGKLGHGGTNWFHQKSLRETVSEKSVNLMIPTLSHESIDYIFSLSAILQGHSKHVELCFDTFGTDFFF